MILGMTVPAFTQLHVLISLIGILAGLLVAVGLTSGRNLPASTALFLAATVLTSVTGFFFHSAAFGPPHVIGVISLVVLAIAIVALYVQHLRGAWRGIYIVTALLALYLNAFVGVVQSFQKIAPLHSLAPKGSEPPFAIAQLVVLALFIWLCLRAFRRFRPVAAVAMA